MKSPFSPPTIQASLILLLTLSMLSCNSSKTTGPTIVAGHLPDLASSEILINTGNQEFIVSADAEGKFRMELDITWDRYLWFNGINNFLYLVAGDSIFISNDASALNPMVFTGGESGLINTWYAVKLSKLSTLLDTVDIKSYYGQDAQSYKKLNTWVISEFHSMLDVYGQENPGISESFIKLEKENISHYWYYEMDVYHIENRAYTGKEPDLPDNFYDYLETVRLNDTMLYQFDGYRYFLYSWLDLQVDLRNQGQKGVDKTHQIFDIAEESFTDPVILADVIWENLRLQNNRMAVDGEILARALALGVGEKDLEDARKYMERLQSLSPGNPAPDFEILDVNDRRARLEDIKHELEGRNIEIITVCLSDEEPWKNKMAEMGLPDEGQYRLENGWGSPFNNNYLKGAGAPTYILIDPEGRFVDARAPFPSQGMQELLEGLPI